MKSQWSNTATVCPNNAIAGQRTSSMPQLLSEQKDVGQPEIDTRNYNSHIPHMNHRTGGSDLDFNSFVALQNTIKLKNNYYLCY